MKNTTIINNREKAIKEAIEKLRLNGDSTIIIELFQTFITLSKHKKINSTFLTEHLKINKEVARVINDAGILNVQTGMQLLVLELERLPKLELEEYWVIEVENKFKKMRELLQKSSQLMDNCEVDVQKVLESLNKKTNQHFTSRKKEV